jgi:hypothetical protein
MEEAALRGGFVVALSASGISLHDKSGRILAPKNHPSMTPTPARRKPGRKPPLLRPLEECAALDALLRGARLTYTPTRGHGQWRLVQDGNERCVPPRVAVDLTAGDDPPLVEAAPGVWEHPCAAKGRAAA